LSYIAKIVFAPFNELLLTFLMYKRPKNIKYLSVGSDWLKKVDAILSKGFIEEINQLNSVHFFDVVYLLVEEMNDHSSIEDIFSYLKSMSAGDMYVKFAQASKHDKVAIPTDIEKERDIFISIMCKWNKEYFSRLPSSVLLQIQETYKMDKNLLNELPAPEVVERLAQGFQIETDEVKKVYLMPSYHFYPLNTFSHLNDRLFVNYPMHLLDTEEERIVTIAKALSDKNRLRILKILHENKLSFTDLLQRMNTTKGNIHHHLSILLTARLIQKHVVENCNIMYSTRPTLLNELEHQITHFLDEQ